MKGAKALLYDVRNEQREINIIKTLMWQAEMDILPSGIRYDKDSVQSSPEDHMLETVTRYSKDMDKYRKQLERHLRSIAPKRSRAIAMISKLDDSMQRQVLELFFLDSRRLTMQQVAESIGYEIAQTYRIYKAALQSLNGRMKT